MISVNPATNKTLHMSLCVTASTHDGPDLQAHNCGKAATPPLYITAPASAARLLQHYSLALYESNYNVFSSVVTFMDFFENNCPYYIITLSIYFS